MADQDEDMPLTLPDTQNAEDMLFTQSQEVTSSNQIIWGTLRPNKPLWKKLEMSQDKYTVGRNVDCDVTLNADVLAPQWLSVMSKVHLCIFRQTLNTGDTVTYLQDLSHNGTFVNRVLVGKENTVILQNNDTISLAQPQFEAYIYMCTSTPESNRLPSELRAKYVVSRTLGSGVCGEVKLLFTILGCKRYAMKTIAKKNFASLSARNAAMDSEKIMNEVRILKALRHPCIIRMEEIVDTPSAVYMVLELMEGGELFDRISACENGLPERVAKLIFYQIVLAVHYLHEHGITHRDLKPENILLASHAKYPLVKISDFGLSKFVDRESMMRTFCGTPMYVAPEILVTNGRGAYTKQVDVWSLGVILYVILTGRLPFTLKHATISLHDQIVKGLYRFSPALFGNISNKATDLIRRMMTTNPNERITIKQVLLHPWLQDRAVRDMVDELISSNAENNRPNNQKVPLKNATNNNKKAFDERPVARLSKRTRLE